MSKQPNIPPMEHDEGDTAADPTPGDDDAPIRGEVRLAGHRRVSHGLYLKHTPGYSSDEEFLRELRAWLLVLPEGAVFTHVTAARLLGWQLPALPEQVPVFAAVGTKDPRPRRPGLICSRLVRETEPFDGASVLGDLPVDQPEEILLRAARDLGTLDLTIMLDSALRLGHIDAKRMETLLASGRPGVRVLNHVWNVADGRTDSAGETVNRRFHQVMGVEVEPQARLHDDAGNFTGQADLLLTGTPYVHEYDGEVHRKKDQQRIDLRRGRGLTGSSYIRNGFSLDELLNHPLVLMHELDRILDRPHRLSRLRAWRRLVENSLYSEAGRERVLNRWRRVGGLVDWSKPA
jgi:hypothetical protein